MVDIHQGRRSAFYVSIQSQAQIVSAIENSGFKLTRLTPAEARAAEYSPKLLVLDAGSAETADEAARMLESFVVQGGQVLILGIASEQRAWEKWLRSGEAIFLQKPVELDYLESLLRDIRAEIPRSHEAEGQTPVGLDQFGLLLGSSPPMRELYRHLRKAAASEASICVHGESGTGKELVARSVHAFSTRCEEPFCAINCGAIPSELVESELFGHEQGSFSSANRLHRGFFERVGAGTLLLDEITEMPESTQVKLLRVLETGSFRRVGGERDLSSGARLITATNRDPGAAIHEGILREDLFYRICQIEIHVPPLRDRGEDITALAKRFMAEFAETTGRVVRLGAEAEGLLRRYEWPGNVRELRHVVHNACRLCRSVITPAHLPQLKKKPKPNIESSNPGVTVGMTLAEVQQHHILATLEAEGGDRKRAADRLGISIRTLYNRLKEYRAAGTLV